MTRERDTTLNMIVTQKKKNTLCVAVFCSVLQVRCNVLQCVAECYCATTYCNTKSHEHDTTFNVIVTRKMYNTLQHTATHCTILHHTATHCNTLQHTATHCSTLQHTAAHCSTLQHRRNTLQHTAAHTAAHCNTLQRRRHTQPRLNH